MPFCKIRQANAMHCKSGLAIWFCETRRLDMGAGKEEWEELKEEWEEEKSREE